MLQSIRDRTQGWIAGIIISILILSFALWGIHSYLASVGINPNVAKVNGIEITKSQLAAAYEQMRRQFQSQYATYNLPDESSLKQQALQSLINVTVLREASLKEGFRISERQIKNFLSGMPEFQVEGQFSNARFQQVLAASSFSISDFFQLINTTLLIDQPRLGMIFTSFALPNEVKDSMALIEEERQIFYITLPMSFLSHHSIVIPNSEIKAYYQEHQNQFKTPEKISVEYLELSLENLIAGMHPTESELQTFYNDNNGSFADPAKWQLESLIVPVGERVSKEIVDQAHNKINAIYQKAHAGADFSKLLQENNLSQNNLYSQEWVTLNKLPVELQHELVHLTQPGQITNPVKIKQGFAIFKVKEYKKGKALSFADAKNSVKENYIHQKAEEQFATMRDTLANLTYEHPDSLLPAAKDLGLTEKETNLFSKNDTSVNEKIRKAAFSNEVLNQQNNSDLIQISSDSVMVIRLKSHQPAALLSLNNVQNQILEKLKSKAINAQTVQLAIEIQKRLQNNKNANAEQIANQYQLKVTPLNFIGRHSTHVDSAILDIAFSIPKPDSIHPITYAIVKIPQGYAIVGLSSVRQGVLKTTDQYRVFAEQIQNTQGLLEYQLYKQSLMQHANIQMMNN